MGIPNSLRRVAFVAAVLAAMHALQGCLATKVVTVPVKVAYGAGKLAVKGTTKAVKAVVPDDEEETESRPDEQDSSQSQPR